jgi:nucleoside-diphosphate-sugar epimerase
VVTGAAGFIGSHLVELLLASGRSVRGVDCLTDFYSPERKRQNLLEASKSRSFEFVEADLARASGLSDLLGGTEVIFHLAAEAGVRTSWGDGFDRYVNRNLLATQRLLEAAKDIPTLRRIVVASSSSVYGDAESFPTSEDGPVCPVSPYGITKLATEHLAGVYARNWGLPTVSLRLFTVFGPRQRPDMAFHRIIQAALTGEPFTVFGTGEQVRDFTYVGDVVRAALAASEAVVPSGSVFNVAGGTANSLNDAIREVESLTRRRVHVVRAARQAGDARRTGGDTRAAREKLGWKAETSLTDGLARQVAWHEALAGLGTTLE